MEPPGNVVNNQNIDNIKVTDTISFDCNICFDQTKDTVLTTCGHLYWYVEIHFIDLGYQSLIFVIFLSVGHVFIRFVRRVYFIIYNGWYIIISGSINIPVAPFANHISQKKMLYQFMAEIPTAIIRQKMWEKISHPNPNQKDANHRLPHTVTGFSYLILELAQDLVLLQNHKVQQGWNGSRITFYILYFPLFLL